MSDDRRDRLIDALKKAIGEVLAINFEQSPDNMKFITLYRTDWIAFRRDIVREVIQHQDLNIHINIDHHDSFSLDYKTIALKKHNNLPATSAEDMERHIDELLSIERWL